MLWFIIILIGLIIGSFLNVVAFRLPQIIFREWKKECKEITAILPKLNPLHEKLSLSLPRSFCRNCHKKIPWYHNIPVLSYLYLCGKCHNCKHSISAIYPIIEITFAAILVLIFNEFGLSYQTYAAAVFAGALLALSVIDYNHQILPDHITLPLTWIGLLVNSHNLFCSLEMALWGAVMGYLAFWFIYQIFLICTKKEGLGYGDFKLLAASGAWLGVEQLPAIVLIASLLAILSALILILNKVITREMPLPFGPALAISSLAVMLYSDDLAIIYTHIINLAFLA